MARDSTKIIQTSFKIPPGNRSESATPGSQAFFSCASTTTKKRDEILLLLPIQLPIELIGRGLAGSRLLRQHPPWTTGGRSCRPPPDAARRHQRPPPLRHDAKLRHKARQPEGKLDLNLLLLLLSTEEIRQGSYGRLSGEERTRRAGGL